MRVGATVMMLAVSLVAYPGAAVSRMDSRVVGEAACVTAPAVAVPATPWAQQRLRPDLVWPVTRGESVTIAVVDTGVDATVGPLAGRVTDGGDILVPARPANTDCAGHGTFVASLAAAAPVDGTGFAGLAPAARILAVRVTTDPTRRTAPVALADGVRRAGERGAKVIVVPAPILRAGPGLRDAVDAARRADAVLIIAADRPEDGDPPVDRATLAGAVSVAATTVDGVPGPDAAVAVDLYAPGVDVLGTVPGGGLSQASGARYATGFVAGAAALMRSRHPGLTAAQVKRRLLDTSVLLAGSAPGADGARRELDVVSAVTVVTPTPTGSRPPALRVRLIRAQGSDGRPVMVAVAAAGIATLTLVAGGAAAVLLPRTRRRRAGRR